MFPNLGDGGRDLAPRSIPDHYLMYVHESVLTPFAGRLDRRVLHVAVAELEAKTELSSR